MKTYWDLTEKERAALDREGVERYIDAELMANGCLRAEPPKFEPVPDAPTMATERWYTIKVGYSATELAFRDAAHAQLIVDACQGGLTDQRVGRSYDKSYLLVAPDVEIKIVPVDVVSRSDFEAVKEQLARIGEVNAVNKSRQDVYDQTVKAQNAVLDGLWKDWYACGQKAQECQEVKNTLAKYTVIADGDETIARRFLSKAFDVVRIEEAEAWFNETFGPVFSDELQQAE